MEVNEDCEQCKVLIVLILSSLCLGMQENILEDYLTMQNDAAIDLFICLGMLKLHFKPDVSLRCI